LASRPWFEHAPTDAEISVREYARGGPIKGDASSLILQVLAPNSSPSFSHAKVEEMNPEDGDRCLEIS
jgi:hypothetical protein